jgi:hypothetical protein
LDSSGRREYDFLGGAARYKTQLALASRPVVQVRAVRPSLVEAVHRLVEWGADRTRGFRQLFTAESAESARRRKKRDD